MKLWRQKCVSVWHEFILLQDENVRWPGVIFEAANIFSLILFFCFTFAIQLDNYEIRPGKRIKVNISVAKVRLFVGNIPKQRSKDEIMAEFSKISGEQKDFAMLLSSTFH